ncbi:MAG: methionyl-tRNA formyltransferase [Syntrophobacterales bacterium]|nr:MAG: methionyl-tRNA formyltransferase [Syntrophobacterales bacterium]
MRVIFMGTPFFALPILRAIHRNNHEVIGVVTQPDRPRGRGRKLGISPVKELAMGLRLPIMQPETPKDQVFIAEVRRKSPELIVVAAYGQILTRDLLDIPPLGCINVHASLLPKYRGASPIQWAIVNGEGRTGITIMKMDEGMDTGEILLAQEVEIESDDTAQSLHDRLAQVGAGLIIKAMDQLERGSLRPIPQDHREATYAPLLKKEDGLIDWNQDARDIFNRIRGFNPWPGAFTYLKGLRLKIFSGKIINEEIGERPGKVVQSGSEGIKVTAGKGSLLIKEVQLEGRKRMSIREFLIGNEIPPGTQMG